jgi:hypothetical protein
MSPSSFLLSVNCFLTYHSQVIIHNNHVSSYSILYNELNLKSIVICTHNRISSKVPPETERPFSALRTITDLQHHLCQTPLCSWEMNQWRWCPSWHLVQHALLRQQRHHYLNNFTEFYYILGGYAAWNLLISLYQ